MRNDLTKCGACAYTLDGELMCNNLGKFFAHSRVIENSNDAEREFCKENETEEKICLLL